jgi:hypothetical protein
MDNNNKIVRVNIVTSNGFKSHSVGEYGVAKIEEVIVDVSSKERQTFFLGRNQLGQELFRISSLCPVEVTRGVYEDYYAEEEII